ncbi:hypothetical protein D9M72_502280 [compost metagenome]
MHGQQRLVGGDHVLAVLDGLEHQLARDAVAADQFDDDIDVRAADHLVGVADDLHFPVGQFARAFGVEIGHHGNLDAAAGAATNFFLIALEHVERAATDGTDAEQANFDGVHGQSSELLRMGCGAAREIRPLPCRGVFGTPRESARCG